MNPSTAIILTVLLPLTLVVFQPLPTPAYASENVIIVPSTIITLSVLPDDGITANTYIIVYNVYNRSYNEIAPAPKNATIMSQTYPTVNY